MKKLFILTLIAVGILLCESCASIQTPTSTTSTTTTTTSNLYTAGQQMGEAIK